MDRQLSRTLGNIPTNKNEEKYSKTFCTFIYTHAYLYAYVQYTFGQNGHYVYI